MTAKLIIGNKNYSSWSLRAWLLLKEAGIEFDEHRIALDAPDSAREIAAFSSAGRVPILLIDDVTVWDTMAIAETAAERWPEKNLWPKDANMRAHARAVCAEIHAGFATIRESLPMNCRAMGRKVPLSDEVARDIDRIIAIWSECHSQYGDGWLFGKFSIAGHQLQYAFALQRSQMFLRGIGRLETKLSGDLGARRRHTGFIDKILN